MTDNGGAAFPTEPNTQPGLYTGLYVHHGMTLRDYFAAAALQGIMASPEILVPILKRAGRDDLPQDSEKSRAWAKANAIAEMAGIMADAMLKERER